MEKQGLFVSFHEWLARPFRSDGSAFQWAMFVGLIIIACWMWNSVILTIVRKTAHVAQETVNA